MLISAVSTINAGEYPAIRPDHPRIMFNADTWPTVKARAEGPAKSQLAKLLKECDKMTDNPVCTGVEAIERKAGRQPDGTVISLSGTSYPPIKEFGTQAAECALAWRFTGNEKYLVKAKKMLTASVDGYVAATNNRRPVSWYSTERINALCAYDWIYEALTDEERAAIIIPLTEHVDLVQPEAKLGIPRQPPGSKNSGFYGMAGLLWYSGLAAYGDGFCDERAKRQLETGYDKFMEVIDYRNLTGGDDGALISGALNYCMGMYPYAHFNFFHSYLSATGKNIADRYPNLALFPYWVWWSWIRDTEKPKEIRYCGSHDFYHTTNTMNLKLAFDHFCQYIHFFKENNPQAAEFTAALREWVPSKKLSFTFPALPFLVDTECDVNPKVAGDLENPKLKARHFEAVGQVVMRSGWKPESTYCTFTAGSPFHQHKHYDENNFTIYKYDHLTLDTGDRGNQNDLNLTYYYAQSVAHNVVLIQDPDEPLPSHWGPKDKDDPKANLNYGGQVNHTPAKILAFETNDNYTYVASDATACYGPKATECVRQLVYVYPDYFVVYDRVGSSDPSYEKDWLLHFKNEPVVKGNVIRADSDGGRIFCQTFLPSSFKIDVIGGPGKEFWVRDRNFDISEKYRGYIKRVSDKAGRGPYQGAWRTELKSSSENSDMRFLNVLTAGSTAMTKPVKAKYVKDEKRDGVVLTIGGKKTTIWFNRDGEVGGAFAKGSDQKPLANEVQAQSGAIL